MSVEPLVISGLIEEGSPRKAFQQGVTGADFVAYQDEWDWLVRQAERQRPINRRLFHKAFPDFEFIPVAGSRERLQDLCDELKSEAAFVALNAGLEQALDDLRPDNVFERASFLRDVLGDVLRSSGATSDILLIADFKKHLEEISRLRIMRENGEAAGIPTGLRSLDHHYGGWLPGRVILVLGRPGSTKSFTLAKFACEGFLDQRRIGLFSPEMNEHEHQCRVGTLLSADPRIQNEIGVKNAFRNRALMEGHGFPVKKYKRFREYIATLPGEIILFTNKYRREKITPGFIDARIDDLGLDMVIVDPIYEVKSPRKRQWKVDELTDISEALADMAETYNIPVMLSNQARRSSSSGGREEAPHKDESYNADAPVHKADHVIGVKYFVDDRKLQLRCSKNRFGQDFKSTVRFLPNIGVFDDITEIKGSYFEDTDEPDDPSEDEH